MKNPWMSAWLSAANQMAATNRGLLSAEMSRQQSAMIKAWSDAATQMWFPRLPKGKK